MSSATNVLKYGLLAGIVSAALASSPGCAAGDDGEVGADPNGGANGDGQNGGGTTSGATTSGTGPRATGADASAAAAIYVSLAGRDDASGATPREPLKSIATAIGRAKKCPGVPCVVLLAGGRYEEAVELADGVSLLGGYAPDFTVRDPARYAVTLTSSSDRTVVAASLTKPTTIDAVSIEGANLSLQDTRSSYGLWVKDSGGALFVSHATIRGGRGGRGLPGAAGPEPTCTAAGGSGGSADDCSASGGQPGNASGDPTAAGEGGGGGSSYCASACPAVGSDGIGGGGGGKAGGNGGDGAGGAAPPNAAGSFTDGWWTPPAGLGGARGLHGTGGGGGGAGGSKRFRACFGCDTLVGGRGGDGAPGGCGGAGGLAGAAGGGAFGVLVDGSQVTLQDVAIFGGVGGDGGAGGPGLAGKPGGTQLDTGRQGGGSQKCGLINYSSGGGGPGGAGGHGGTGGGGAGGVGGPSIGLALVGRASIVRYGAVTTAAGAAGAPGAGGFSAGNAGSGGPAGIAEAEHAF